MAATELKFYRGLKRSYNAELYRDGIYFTLDSDVHEILMNGQSYGFKTDISLDNYVTHEFLTNALTGYVKSATYDPETHEFQFFGPQDSDGSPRPLGSPIVFPLASSESDGLMSKEDKVKLDSIQSGAEVNEINDVATDLGTFKVLNKVATLEISDAIDSKINAAITSKFTGLYRYSGSVQTYNDLPGDAEPGDTYNVVDVSIVGDKKYPAGTNFAWTGTEWDALGGVMPESIDLTPITDRLDILEGNIETSGSVLNTIRTEVTEKYMIWNEVSES